MSKKWKNHVKFFKIFNFGVPEPILKGNDGLKGYMDKEQFMYMTNPPLEIKFEWDLY